MIFGGAAIVSLAQRCSPTIATEAIVPLVMTESGGDALAININKGPLARVRTIEQGAALVRRYIGLGYTVDVGLAQINSANFARLGVSVEQAFDPCTNLRLSGQLLRESYGFASRYYRGLGAISATYSLYNTGTLTRGFLNGYVGRVWSAAIALQSFSAVSSLAVLSSTAIVARGSAVKNADIWVFGQHSMDGVEVFK